MIEIPFDNFTASSNSKLLAYKCINGKKSHKLVKFNVRWFRTLSYNVVAGILENFMNPSYALLQKMFKYIAGNLKSTYVSNH
jgi:hypothetical protein